MDLRIVNTCNNDCIYCLEQDLRVLEPFLDYQEICKVLDTEKDRKILCFYGGNPLLHPRLLNIIEYAKSIGYDNISLLSNTYTLNESYISDLKNAGLNTLQFYFHSFDQEKHIAIVQEGIHFKELMKNIRLIQMSGLQDKVIIHVNAQNIDTLLRDIKALHKYFSISSFELINYYPVSRAYQKYDLLLRYDENLEFLGKIKKFINQIQGNLKLIRFSL